MRLKAHIETQYQSSVHENSLFYVTNQSVLGEQFLAIEPGSTDRPVLAEGSAVRGLDPPRLDMLIAEMYELLHSTVSTHPREQGGDRRGVRRAAQDAQGHRATAWSATRTTSTASSPTSRRSPTTPTTWCKGAKGKFVENPQIDRILASADKVSDEAARELPPLLADGRATLASARRLAETVGDPKEQAKLRQALDDVAVVASRAKGMTGDAAEILAHVKRGKGTVGAVVMDEQIYDDLQELVRDLKHNPWKFFWRE